jgi:hypothetical protein
MQNAFLRPIYIGDLGSGRMLAKKDGNVKKEPWDSSTEKAKTLKIEDFGTPDEVLEMVKTIRAASNRREATEYSRKL